MLSCGDKRKKEVSPSSSPQFIFPPLFKWRFTVGSSPEITTIQQRDEKRIWCLTRWYSDSTAEKRGGSGVNLGGGPGVNLGSGLGNLEGNNQGVNMNDVTGNLPPPTPPHLTHEQLFAQQ
ncbi:hypothetical protein RYX36_019812 [Vicia faba]